MNDSRTPTPPPIDTQAFKRFEHRGWVDVAPKYDSVFGTLTIQATEWMLDAVGVGEGARFLDVACGPGHLAAAAGARGARAAGIDFSSTMVAEARRLHPAVDFREGDAEALPYQSAAFDAVAIGFGMLHFADPERALREAFRVLAPGGRVAFSVWDAPQRAIGFGIVRSAIEAHGHLDVPLPPGPDFFRFSDHAECRAVLQQAGFSEPHVENVTLVWRIGSPDAMLDGFLEAGVRTRGILQAQTPKELAAIREAIRVASKPYAKDGALELPTPCVIASGRKP